MYPSLYDLFADLFGIHFAPLEMIKSFGFFVALAFILAAYFFAEELKRKEKEGLVKPNIVRVLKGEKVKTSELIVSFFLGFIVGYKLLYVALNFSAFTEDTQGYLLSLKGNLLGAIIGGIISAYLKYYEKEKEKLPEPVWVEETVHPFQEVGNMTLIAAISGIAGAKIFNSLENWGDFLRDPIASLISFSGLTIYGGLIFGTFFVLLYAHKKGLKLLHVVDACAPSLILSYGIGRIGCQVAGDGDWGIDNLAPKPHALSFLPDWMWTYHYPHNVNDVGIPIPGCVGDHCMQLANPVFPTPFYETTMALLLFFFLWSIRKKIKVPGVLFCVYLMVNGMERFLIELIRVNTKYIIFGHGITQAQLISPLFFLVGIIGIIYLSKKYSKNKFSEA
ncbi:MAG: prolipoprotein diacylglyceryl transferase family protein [Bacteroidia bacterium]